MPLRDFAWCESDSNVSKHTWRAWYRQGRFEVVRLGRRVLIDEAAYRRFLDENRVAARPAK